MPCVSGLLSVQSDQDGQDFRDGSDQLPAGLRGWGRILSHSEVYGDPEVHLNPKSTAAIANPIGLRACYDEGKRYAETLFFDYHRENKVDIRVVRIQYGPRMLADDGRVVSNFIVQALRREPSHETVLKPVLFAC